MELVGQRVEHQHCTLLRRERGEEWREMFPIYIHDMQTRDEEIFLAPNFQFYHTSRLMITKPSGY